MSFVLTKIFFSCMCSCSLVCSLTLIFTLLVATISHFLTAAIKFSSCSFNEIGFFFYIYRSSSFSERLFFNSVRQKFSTKKVLILILKTWKFILAKDTTLVKGLFTRKAGYPFARVTLAGRLKLAPVYK